MGEAILLQHLRESATKRSEPQGERYSRRSLIFLSFTFSNGLLNYLCEYRLFMPRPPQSPDRLPTLEHAGVHIEALQHYGFSIPDRGTAPKPRLLYGARNPEDGERHWRSSYDEIVSLIDRGFVASGEAS